MKDEIKEIIDDIKDYSEHEYLPPCCELTNEECKHLLDYITNLQEDIRTGQEINSELQQENERLKDSIDWWKDRFFGQQEYDDSHRITAIEYKKRIEEAIQLYQTCKEEDWCTLPIDMVNILQDGSEEK